MPGPSVVPSYSERLKAAAQYAEDCKQLYRNALAARNQLIVEAVDGGHSGHQVARDTGLRQPSIIRILSQSQPDLNTLDVRLVS